MEVKTDVCRQCRKEVKNEIHRCIPCEKYFHPGCVKLHKVYNSKNEYVPCTGKFEIIRLKADSQGSVQSGNMERKGGDADIVDISTESACGGVQEILKILNMQRQEIEKLKKIIEEKSIREEKLIRETIQIQVREEMTRERSKMEGIINELRTVLEALKDDRKKFVEGMPKVERRNQKEDKKKSYSEAVIKKNESVIIVKPAEESKASTSEITKQEIKNKVNVAKLGVGITKMRKATRGAVVIGCENKTQAEILMNKVSTDLGDKYIVKAPQIKNVKIRIYNIDKEDCEEEQELWKKVEEQNGYMKDSIHAKIMHKSVNEKSRSVTVIAVVDLKTRDLLLKEDKLKIGWNICKVQSYIGILRCFKCCGYYHFAKECKKEEACGKCAGKHANKECKSEVRKCVICEEKKKNFGIKNLDTSHSAFDAGCPFFKREMEKQISRISGSL